jgi:hypothetical protein
VVEAKQNYVRFFTPPPIPHGRALTRRQDGMDYRMMKDLKLIDARPEGRSVWELTIPRYLCNNVLVVMMMVVVVRVLRV